MRSFRMLRSCIREVDVEGNGRVIHRSELVSISPNSNLLPALLLVAADVADAADETVEKEEDGLLARIDEVSCLLHILEKAAH